jgi:hypothetical protein
MIEYVQFLESHGISLASLGLRELALKRNDALLAVEILAQSRVPILGGDVYFARDSQIEPAYANWFTERLSSDTLDSYVDRSCDKTQKYISEFPQRPDVEPLFVFVVKTS